MRSGARPAPQAVDTGPDPLEELQWLLPVAAAGMAPWQLSGPWRAAALAPATHKCPATSRSARG